MAYIKNTWVDQVVERPRTYEMINNSDGSVTLIDSFGLVSEIGTPVNADNMNHIEEGIAACSITKYDSETVYSKNDLITDINENELTIYLSLKDNNIGNSLTDENFWKAIELDSSLSGDIENKLDTDLSNLSDVGERSLKDSIMNNIMPDYSAGVELSVLTTDQVIQKNGWIFVSGIQRASATVYFYINDEVVFMYHYNASSGTGGSSGFIPIYKGDKYKCSSTTYITNLTFYPMKGVV